MSRREQLRELELRPGEARLPGNFAERLTGLKQRSGLTWEALAAAVGVDSRQLLRWRRGSAPSGGAMLSLCRLAARVPGGLSELLGEEWSDPRRSKRASK